MTIKTITMAAAGLAMIASPVAASAAAANPAANLSVSKSVRAGSATTAKNKAAGGGIALAILAGVAAIGVIAIVNDDNSDSN
ncbi:hypothetical protein U1701_13330 [Sphingomonas sp. PB2P19]|uniref:hypothetical protein n=1 Tax=Sphingomonas rhamnosi TaxID=3096156 RepID=UPI002FC84798